jgi:glyoxylase-like metal-dependent hydrolase (beta-lactamase superfamily II)
MAPILHKITDQITLIDLQFQSRPNVIGSYLFHDGKQAALLESGPASTVERLIEGIQAAGVPLDSLHQVLVTHIHHDHAGAAGVLARRYPWIKVYVHPVGAPHLADPTKLIASAARLYGERMEALWGKTEPVPTENIAVINDGDQIKLPGATIRAFDTPGHASHHHAYLDSNSGSLFTGDVAGVRKPGVRYVRPPTPPPELNIEAWRASIAKLRAVQASGLCLTHFGVHRDDIAWHWDDLDRRLVQWGEIIREEMAGGASEDAMIAQMKAQSLSELKPLGIDIGIYDVAGSYETLVAGYARYWKKKMIPVKT